MILLEISPETPQNVSTYSEHGNILKIPTPSLISPYFWKCLRTDLESERRDGKKTNIHLNKLISVYVFKSKDRLAINCIPILIISTESGNQINYLPLSYLLVSDYSSEQENFSNRRIASKLFCVESDSFRQ